MKKKQFSKKIGFRNDKTQLLLNEENFEIKTLQMYKNEKEFGWSPYCRKLWNDDLWN